MKLILFGLVAVATFSMVYCTGTVPHITTTVLCLDGNGEEVIPMLSYGLRVTQRGKRVYLPNPDNM